MSPPKHKNLQTNPLSFTDPKACCGQNYPRSVSTATDPSGYGLGVQQQFSRQTGIFWDYEGQAFGARVLHLYFPRTGLLIAVAANSSASHDDLANLSGAVYQTLQKAGAARTG